MCGFKLAKSLGSKIKYTIVLIMVSSMCLDPRMTKGTTSTDECQVTPVIHVLQYPGCVPKPIPSFACIGRCASYLQVSGSKIWQMERSCMCCQESGEREASVSLFCPKAKPGEKKFRKVSTKAPLECMCRPCTGVEESAVIPQEIAGYADEGPLSNHFLKSHAQ
ncbi:bursicon-like [Atheta coriaria]|uniref:bursicon-like n=1 Tax=Dalotia coriaria TaxID=877792 RepID=UPI0031F387E7